MQWCRCNQNWREKWADEIPLELERRKTISVSLAIFCPAFDMEGDYTNETMTRNIETEKLSFWKVESHQIEMATTRWYCHIHTHTHTKIHCHCDIKMEPTVQTFIDIQSNNNNYYYKYCHCQSVFQLKAF